MLQPQKHSLLTTYCHFPKDYINKYAAFHPLRLQAFSCKRRMGACTVVLTTGSWKYPIPFTELYLHEEMKGRLCSSQSWHTMNTLCHHSVHALVNNVLTDMLNNNVLIYFSSNEEHIRDFHQVFTCRFENHL